MSFSLIILVKIGVIVALYTNSLMPIVLIIFQGVFLWRDYKMYFNFINLIIMPLVVTSNIDYLIFLIKFLFFYRSSITKLVQYFFICFSLLFNFDLAMLCGFILSYYIKFILKGQRLWGEIRFHKYCYNFFNDLLHIINNIHTSQSHDLLHFYLNK